LSHEVHPHPRPQLKILTLPVVWVVVSLVFLLIHLVPGDPIQQMLGEGATAADLSALRHQYGLDLPLGTQYLHYWRDVLHGDLGRSIRLNDTVLHLISTRYPLHHRTDDRRAHSGPDPRRPRRSYSAVRRGRWQDHASASSASSAFRFPPSRSAHPDPGLLHRPRLAARLRRRIVGAIFCREGWKYLVLPSVAMGVSLAAILTRMVRTAMLEELNRDYIRTARAKGLS
jgi:hypothetical protein